MYHVWKLSAIKINISLGQMRFEIFIDTASIALRVLYSTKCSSWYIVFYYFKSCLTHLIFWKDCMRCEGILLYSFHRMILLAILLLNEHLERRSMENRKCIVITLRRSCEGFCNSFWSNFWLLCCSLHWETAVFTRLTAMAWKGSEFLFSWLITTSYDRNRLTHLRTGVNYRLRDIGL